MAVVAIPADRRTAREQTRARVPGRDRLRRARRRPGLLGALRRGQPDDPADAVVDDRPLAHLEGADPLPRAPLPGRRVRRPRQRPLRPADRRRRATRTPSSRPTRSPSSTPTAPSVPWRWACPWAPGSRCGSRSRAPERVLGLVLFGSTVPRSTAPPMHPRTPPTRASRSRSPTTTAGTSTTRHYWRRDWSGLRRLVRRRADLLGAALDQAGRGHGGLDARDRSRDDDRDQAGAVPRPPGRLGARAGDRGPRPARSRGTSRCPVLVVHGTDDHIIPIAAGRRLAAELGAPMVEVEGGGHSAIAREPVRRQPADPRLRPGPGGTAVIEDRRRSRASSRADGRRLRPGQRPRAPAGPDRASRRPSDGVRLAFDVYGDGDTTLVLLPSTPIVHSRQWKGQIHYLSRHFRVVAFDGRGNGRSDRPTDPEAYTDERMVGDLVAVMDAAGHAATPCSWACAATACGGPIRARGVERRSASQGIVAFAVGVPRLIAAPPVARQYVVRGRAAHRRRAGRSSTATTGSATTRASPASSSRRSRPSRIRRRPSTTRSGWAVDGSVEAMLAESDAPFDLDAERPSRRSASRCAARCSSSTARRTTASRRRARIALAELTGAPLVIVEGADHMIPGRHPVLANLLIRQFVESLPEVRA